MSQSFLYIHECFLDLTGMNQNLEKYGRKIKDTVLEWTTLPICVGIGHSKTLAKLANKVAKNQDRFRGVCDFTQMSEAELDALLEQIDVEKVWGGGRRYAARLNKLGVQNVLRLKRASPRRVRDEFGIMMMRTVQELNGIPCQELTEDVEPSQQVMSSRSFGQRASTLQGLREAITFHAATATARLREQGLLRRPYIASFRIARSTRGRITDEV